MDTVFIIAQILGFGGMASFIASYQCRSNHALFICQTLGTILFATQFIMLGGFSGCAILLITLFRNVFLLNIDKKWASYKFWPVLVVALYIVATIFTYNGLASLLPVVAMTATTVGMWTRSGGKIRISNLFIACPAWIIYDVCFKSYFGILSETFSIISILISIKRFGLKALWDAETAEKPEMQQ